VGKGHSKRIGKPEMSKKDFYRLMPFFAFATIFTLLFLHKPFFWDKDILDSKQAHWLLNSSFDFVFPNQIDSGHPPFIATLLALAWSVFGQSLAVSHLIMLPFTLGLIYQSYLLIKKVTDRHHYMILLLVLLDTSVLTQMITVSSDLAILFFLLLNVNALLAHKRKLLMLGLMGLALINMRSMILCFVLFVFDFILNYKNSKWQDLVKNSLYYIPGGLLASGFLAFHYLSKGWIMYHDQSPWIGCFEKVGAMGFFRNLALFIWRIIDFGRVIYAVFTILIVVWWVRKKIQIDKRLHPLLLLIVLLTASYIPNFRYENLISIRYVLPLIVMISIFVLAFLVEKFRKANAIFLIVALFLIGGNFIVYPDKIAQAWDATLAHTPYHGLHKKMLVFMDQNKIPINETGSKTPNLSKLKFVYLNNNESSFKDVDIKQDPYVLYSNIYNDFNDNEIDILNEHWIEKKRLQKLNIKLILYQNPNIKENEK
jgi:hypothetical protein